MKNSLRKNTQPFFPLSNQALLDEVVGTKKYSASCYSIHSNVLPINPWKLTFFPLSSKPERLSSRKSFSFIFFIVRHSKKRRIPFTHSSWSRSRKKESTDKKIHNWNSSGVSWVECVEGLFSLQEISIFYLLFLLVSQEYISPFDFIIFLTIF